MASKWLKSIAGGLLMSAVMATSGCMHLGPHMGISVVPIPVSPYFQDREEDEFWEHERYERVPILGPITAGGPAQALDPPSDDQIIRALGAEPSGGGRFSVPARSPAE